jgi:hypothetical protein
MAAEPIIPMRELPARPAQPWLLSDAERAHYGPEAARPDEVAGNYRLQVGDRPFVRNLRELYTLSGRAMPPELAVLKGDVYLVAHAVGLIAQAGANNVRILGYQASFTDRGATVELLPNTLFKEWFKANLTFQAGLTVDGHAKLPEEVGAMAQQLPAIDLGLGAKLELGTQAKVVGKLQFSIKSPKIQTVGHASSSVNWQFHRDENPLVGDQVLIQTLLVPAGQESVTFKIQGYAVVGYGWWSAGRIETSPITALVELPG